MRFASQPFTHEPGAALPRALILLLAATGSLSAQTRTTMRTVDRTLTAPVVSITGVADRATVSWAAVPNAALYVVARTQVDAAGAPIGASVEQRTSATSLTDALPEPDAAYVYLVTPLAADYSIGPATRLQYNTPSFRAPAGVTVAGAGGRVAIAWCPAPGVAGYQIMRRQINPDGSVANLTQVTRLASGSSYIDTLPGPGTYEFQAIAVGMDYRTWPGSWVRFVAAAW